MYSKRVLNSINQLFRKAYNCRSIQEIGQACLSAAEEVTESKYGFICEFSEPGKLAYLAISKAAWLESKMDFDSLPAVLDLRGIRGTIVNEGMPILTNDPINHPKNVGMPPGHPPINSFLGVPLLDQEKALGLIAVANRPGGYRPDDLLAMEALSDALVQVLKWWRTDHALRISQEELAQELMAADELQNLSTLLIQADNAQDLYDRILDTALLILKADFASLQLYHPQRGENGQLELLGFRGFNQLSARHWQWVTPESRSTCGLALKTRERSAVADVRDCDFMYSSSDLEMYLQNGILAVQTTPLISRTGVLVGVFSTHWQRPHELSSRECRCLDLLARQAADLITSKLTEESLAQANKELQLINSRKDSFIGTLSHEIRNPLTSITLGLSLLDQLSPESEEAAVARSMMKRQAKQLARLVDDLLDVTRIAKNKIVLKLQKVEFGELVRKTIHDYLGPFQEKGIEVNIRLASEKAYAKADPIRIAQVICNVLHNAAKFTPAGGLVVISTDLDSSRYYIRVRDYGIGMSPELQTLLFAPFVQADESLAREGGGLGLGLSLAKGLLTLHKGTITAHSDGLGKGSHFTISLPLCRSGEGEAIPGKDQIAPVRSLRILVIEDNTDVANLLQAILAGEGHEVAVAHDGHLGLAKTRECRPDVVICDVGLPGLDGYRVARAIRQDRTLDNICLISLTGYTRPEDVKRAKEAGFDHQLAKPVEPREITAMLANLSQEKKTRKSDAAGTGSGPVNQDITQETP